MIDGVGLPQIKKGAIISFSTPPGRPMTLLRPGSARPRAQARFAVRKAKRLAPSWVASVDHWHEMLKNYLSNMKLAAAVVALFHNVLIPLLYLQRVIGQTRDTERRKELQKVQEKLHGVFMVGL